MVISTLICGVSLFVFIITILENNTALDFTFLMILVGIFIGGGVIFNKSQNFKFKKAIKL